MGEIRRLQSSAMETTVFMPRKEAAATKTETVVAATNTSATAPADSPTWSSGSGAIKEIRLHDAEMKVKSLEKENAKVKEREEFYINKAREWKNKYLKLERTAEVNGFPLLNKASQPKIQDQAEATNPPNTENEVNRLREVQNIPDQVDTRNNPPTPTELMKLDLSRRPEPRRTEADFKLPAKGKSKDDCKTQ